jgi:hypothetical protein
MQQQPTQQRKGKFFWGIFALLFLCGPCNALREQVTPQEAAPTAQEQVILTASKTTVLHRVGSSEAEVLLDQAAEVHKGDLVAARAGGEGLLQFPDAVWVRIFQYTKLQYKTEIDPNAEPVRRLFLEKGAITGESLAEQRAARRLNLEIETDWALIREIGTHFWVYYEPETDINWVVVREGVVELTAINNGQSVTIPAGYQSWLLADGVPAEPVPALRSEITRFGFAFPPMDELSLGAITEVEWLSSQSSAPLVDTPTLQPVLPTDTPVLQVIDPPTDTPPEPLFAPATETPLAPPEPIVAADTTGPSFLSELIYDPIVLDDHSCAPTSYLHEFRIFVDDPSGISSVEFWYFYSSANQTLSEQLVGYMKATVAPQEFVLQLDIGEEARLYLGGQAGQLQYTLIATDNAGNSTPLPDGKPIEIPIPRPC